MARAKQDLVPRRDAETSATVYGRALINRQRAVLEDVFNQVKDTPAYRKAAADQFIADPIGSAERLEKMYGEKEGAKGANPLMSISNLYLQAIQGAQQPAAPHVLELEPEPGTSRVQPSASDW
jgi:hypothetical protein